MIYFIFAILTIILVILAVLVFKLSRNKQDVFLHQKIDSLKDDFTKNILASQGHFLDSSKAVSENLSKLYEKIGGLGSESKEILNLTKSFHNVLMPTKSRGELGESILENLLKDVLPREAVISQYTFKDGKKVDFGIKLPAAVVPIDAKFSMEVFKNYLDAPEQDKNRLKRACIDSIKKRITETAGYIYPDEGTTDFALMYIPSEAVYYFIVTETLLLNFAHQKKIFVVGPNTLYAYLKTIFVGFQAMKIEEKAKEIYNNLQRLEKDMSLFTREYEILGLHIRSASSKYDDVAKRTERISLKLQNIAGSNDSESESIPAGQEASS
ncbi:MAG: DNA recombination protein RmuC [Candidatus Omnitrophota bacterium]